jgi:ubiquinol-cytochrome c reductase cytochrome b subunit
MEMKKMAFIGPHNIDILAGIFGSLLGDSHAQKRSGKTRIILKQGNCNQAYLFAIHKYISVRGYCNIEKPKQKSVIGKNNKVYFFRQIRTYSFASFNWLHEAFYPDDRIKRVPRRELLDQFLTPLALGIWISDDGSAVKGGGVIIATECFSEEDNLILCEVLDTKYGILATVPKYGVSKAGNQQYRLYIRKQSLEKLIAVVSSFMVPSMLRKLHVKV